MDGNRVNKRLFQASVKMILIFVDRVLFAKKIAPIVEGKMRIIA